MHAGLHSRVLLRKLASTFNGHVSGLPLLDLSAASGRSDHALVLDTVPVAPGMPLSQLSSSPVSFAGGFSTSHPVNVGVP